MDILEFALEKERLSREFYHNLADKAENIGLRNIFLMLVDQESEHCRIIEKMKAHVSPLITQTDVLGDARRIFEEMKEASEKFDFDVTELDLYREARAKEIKSRQFYLEKAREVDNPEQEDIFRKLAAQELKHYILLDNICDFVSEPECYLENAEFVHIENYPV